MKLLIQTPAKALNKAYLKQNVQQNKIQAFQDNIHNLFEKLNPNESEENQKNLVRDFLNHSYYKDRYELNTSGREDLAIHRGKTAKDAVGVIIENKKINSLEMMTDTRPNVKSLHELIYYYFVEREVKKNIEVSHLIATDLHNWYVFDENDFRKTFYENPAFKKIYQTKIQQKKDNGFFYSETKKLIETLTDLELPCAYFSFDTTKRSDAAQIALYKLLSPEHLLKLPFENDANSLNREFYNELLYIIGLEEVKEGGKKIIQRKSLHQRNEGSLLENAINEIEVDNALFNLDNLNTYGQNQEEQLFNVGLELCITWLNRILFLKLLEGQLIKYHHGSNQAYAFLNENRVKDFKELSELFFEVLAVPTHLRKPSVTERYGNIPYLNSSLFELTELERKTVKIKDLKDRLGIKIYAQTVLKGDKGKRQTGEMPTVKYLFDFLDAYDFASDSSAQIQEQAKTIINASVLGLIFEKINGYRDGSFFTPGFITMYMCRETLRKAVLEKFRPVFADIEISSFEDLKEHLDITKKEKRQQYNDIVNSLRVCDPAVGSGHFLVSALNELIAIKHDLQILCYRDGSRVKEYQITIENDELIILDEESDQLFEYRLNQANKPMERLQKLQETLFHEKETIIENCLFGVDINPNSVKICRLRLWIELLKNAYYVVGGIESINKLQTLPNIDINIKTGNSLVARFGLEEDLSEVFKKQKFSVKDYKQAVYDYKNSPTKERKAEVLRFIDDIKNQFVQSVYKRDPLRQKLNSFRGQLIVLKTQNIDLFGNNIKEDAEIETIRLERLIAQREAELENIINSPIYRNAFEWRFEFPEVLDEEGKFVGFDAVVGNPPYVIISKNTFNNALIQVYVDEYTSIKKSTSKNLYPLFIEKGICILNSKGVSSMIVPEGLFSTRSYKDCVDLMNAKGDIVQIISVEGMIFEEAVTGSIIFIHSKNRLENLPLYYHFDKDNNVSYFEKKLFPIIEKLTSNPKNKNLNEICSLFKGMAVKDRKDFIFEDKLNNEKDIFLLGNCISKWSIHRQFYTNYKDLTIVGGTKLKEKHDVFPRILIRRTGNFLCCGFLDKKALTESTLYSCWSIKKEINNLYILGVLHSKVLNYIIKNKFVTNEQAFPQILMSDLESLPIPFASSSEQRPIINLVEKILSLKKENTQATTQDLEDEIDELVFELYGLSAEERAVVLGEKL